MKIRRMGGELFRADRQIDTKLLVAFRNFVNAPQNIIFMQMVNVLVKNVGLILPDFTVSHSYLFP